MSAIPINFSQAYMRGVYLISANDVLTYGILTLHPIDQHICAYLNVNRERWYRQRETFRFEHDITFEGIGSPTIQVPPKVQNVIPIYLADFWIGIDYHSAAEQPSAEQVLNRLTEIFKALEP